MVKLVEKIYIDRFESYVYVYNVSGIDVIFVDKECDEFAFNATIYNKHKNNKGLPHMVEHCTFGGSEKYNIKEPFEYLVQEKRYTYLNAITFRDRVVYPFSTYNINDFDEILDVYLDAIFNPILSEETLKQECIRSEKTGYNGIVLNEMIEMYDGDYSRRNRLLSYFGKNDLKFDSAGNPEEIVNVIYSEVLDYYKDAYVLNNVVISFYGIKEHSKYLQYIEENLIDSRILKNTEYQLDNYNSETENSFDNKVFFEINCMEEKSCKNFIIAYENKNFYENKIYSLIFDYIFICKKDMFLSFLVDDNLDCELIYSRDRELSTNLAYLTFLINGNNTIFKNKNLDTPDFVEAILKILGSIDLEEFKGIIINNDFDKKNKDYGYKSEGIFDLLELTKIKCGFIDKYYNKDIFFNINNIDVENSESVLLELYNNLTNIMVKSHQKHLNSLENTIVQLKCIEKNILSDFIYSTNYDIIDMIIIIKFDNNRMVENYVYNWLEINKNLFNKYEFIKNVYVDKIKNKLGDIEFSIHLAFYTNEFEENFEEVCSVLRKIELKDLFFVKSIMNFGDLVEVSDYINFVLGYETLKNLGDYVDNYVDIANKYVAFECYMIDKTLSKFNKIYSFEQSLQHIEVNHFNFKYIKKDFNKIFNSEVIETEEEDIVGNVLYKNFLILELENSLDFMYLELLLEYFLNEVLYKTIRLENGAYEVGYNIIKLENKVVIYSNIDKYSEQTFDIFEKGLQNLNVSYVSELEKYKNKVANNFYRNERDKHSKIMKNYRNSLLNISGLFDDLEIKKIGNVIRTLKNAKVLSKCSFSKGVLKDYKSGGMYVNR